MNFEDIYDEYFRDVFYFALGLAGDRNVAEDVAQEAFMRALKYVDDYDGLRDCRAWLFTIARNVFYDHCRRKKRDLPMEDIELTDESAALPEKLADAETAYEIHRFLHDMKEPFKEVFNLRVFGELPYERIGAIFGKSSGWARVVYYRAKMMIISHMEECENGK